MNFKSSFLLEFCERGFYDNCTHPEILDKLLSDQIISAYIGFDCTAKSLHAGSLIQIMILRLLQKHGHRPIILLGGGTTKIGDPSGKDSSRQILNKENIEENLKGIKKTLSKFLFDDKPNQAIFVDNSEWLDNLNYINFLRDIGKHFSINKMLNFDSVKLRLQREQNLSFLEFNYMILQAYDFYILNQNYDCQLQIGGSDQWGNIINGVELTRKIAFEKDDKNSKREVYGITTPLLVNASGQKMGKTADGALWLDEDMINPFEYFQFFRNVNDKDVIKFLKLFTELEISQIKELEKLQGSDINKAKEILAFEATKICHGHENANKSLKKAQEIFINKSQDAFTSIEIKLDKNIDKEKKLTEIIKSCQASESLGQAKKLIQGQAVKINDQIINDVNYKFDDSTEFNLRVGKKKFFKIKIIIK